MLSVELARERVAELLTRPTNDPATLMLLAYAAGARDAAAHFIDQAAGLGLPVFAPGTTPRDQTSLL